MKVKNGPAKTEIEVACNNYVKSARLNFASNLYDGKSTLKDILTKKNLICKGQQLQAIFEHVP